MSNPYPVSGLKGYWRVRGRGYVATSQETKGGTFHDFEVTVILDGEGNILRADFKLLQPHASLAPLSPRRAPSMNLSSNS